MKVNSLQDRLEIIGKLLQKCGARFPVVFIDVVMSTQYENLSFFPPGTNASTQSTLHGFIVHPASRPKVVSLIKHEEPALAFIVRRRNCAEREEEKKKLQV